MRGKVAIFQELLQKVGITPAHAGKRLENDLEKFESEDHPRPCGEKLRQ